MPSRARATRVRSRNVRRNCATRRSAGYPSQYGSPRAVRATPAVPGTHAMRATACSADHPRSADHPAQCGLLHAVPATRAMRATPRSAGHPAQCGLLHAVPATRAMRTTRAVRTTRRNAGYFTQYRPPVQCGPPAQCGPPGAMRATSRSTGHPCNAGHPAQCGLRGAGFPAWCGRSTTACRNRGTRPQGTRNEETVAAQGARFDEKTASHEVRQRERQPRLKHGARIRDTAPQSSTRDDTARLKRRATPRGTGRCHDKSRGNATPEDVHSAPWQPEPRRRERGATIVRVAGKGAQPPSESPKKGSLY